MVDTEKAKNINNGDPWMLAEDIPDIDFHFSQIWLSSFVNDSEKTIGVNYKKILCVYRGYNLKFFYGEKESDEMARCILDRIIEDPAFGEKINSEIRRLSAKLKKFSEKITSESLVKLSNKEFVLFHKKLDQVHTELYTWGWLPNAVDMFHANYTNYLKDIVSKRLPENRVAVSLMTLSTSGEKSVVQQEHESLLTLAVFKQKSAPGSKFEKALIAHCKKYFYFKHLWIGKEGVYDVNHYQREVEAIIASGENVEELLMKEQRTLREAMVERKALLKELKLDKKQVRVFDIYADFAVTKLIRRDAQLYWAYQMDFMFEQISKRLGVTLTEAHFFMPEEMYSSLENGLTSELRKVVAKRTERCVYYAEKGVDIIVTGQDCDFFENTIQKEKVFEMKELRGQVACVGKVTGIVKIVNSVADMKKVNDGDVLVSIATNPDILPAMKRAVAFVTEQGGITSHAAIVAREMKKPCIIGTKIATKVLKDGDLVEVDANTGVVRIISKI